MSQRMLLRKVYGMARSIRLALVEKAVGTAILLAMLLLTPILVRAQSAGMSKSGTQTTGFAAKKPVFGGACPTCPWGSIAEVVKRAMQFYGYDVQICYYCAGGPREARLVAGAKMATPPQNPGPDTLPTPKGPIDLGATTPDFLLWAYQGRNDFAKDPEGPRKNLRLVANIQEPNYYIVAVKADSGITDLHQILEKRMKVKVMASTGIGGMMTTEIVNYFGLTKEKLGSFGGELETKTEPENRKNLDVIIGWGALENAPEYHMWYEVSQKYDLKYLKLPDDLLDHLAKQYDLDRGTIPVGLLRGIDAPIPTVTRTGAAIYGRTDMPDDFAYTLAKAMDEHQDLLQWANSGMNFSYNWRTVWKALGVPVHPGAEKYYKEKGYMK